MLALDKCRKLLGYPDLTDDEVTEIRDNLYLLVEVMVDDFIKKKRVEPSSYENDSVKE